MNIKFLKIPCLLLFSLLTSVANLANATAIANAEATATLTITDISNITNPGDLTGLSLSGESSNLFDFTLIEGNANAATSSQTVPGGIVDLSVNEGLQQQAIANSEANPTGFSVAAILTEGFIDIINDSLTDTFEIAFSLDFSLSALANVTNTALEDAFSIVEIVLFDDLFDIDIIEIVEADTLFGPFSDVLTDNIDFLLTLDPDSSNQLFLEINATTLTQSVPEPSAIILMLLGVLIFSWQQKKSPAPSVNI